MEGRRRRGRPRKQYIDNIKQVLERTRQSSDSGQRSHMICRKEEDTHQSHEKMTISLYMGFSDEDASVSKVIINQGQHGVDWTQLIRANSSVGAIDWLRIVLDGRTITVDRILLTRSMSEREADYCERMLPPGRAPHDIGENRPGMNATGLRLFRSHCNDVWIVLICSI